MLHIRRNSYLLVPNKTVKQFAASPKASCHAKWLACLVFATVHLCRRAFHCLWSKTTVTQIESEKDLYNWPRNCAVGKGLAFISSCLCVCGMSEKTLNFYMFAQGRVKTYLPNSDTSRRTCSWWCCWNRFVFFGPAVGSKWNFFTRHHPKWNFLTWPPAGAIYW